MEKMMKTNDIINELDQWQSLEKWEREQFRLVKVWNDDGEIVEEIPRVEYFAMRRLWGAVGHWDETTIKLAKDLIGSLTIAEAFIIDQEVPHELTVTIDRSRAGNGEWVAYFTYPGMAAGKPSSRENSMINAVAGLEGAIMAYLERIGEAES